MSDYLTRLIERTLGTGTLVHPRIAPRFASGPPLEVNFEETVEQIDATPGDNLSSSMTGQPDTVIKSQRQIHSAIQNDRPASSESGVEQPAGLSSLELQDDGTRRVESGTLVSASDLTPHEPLPAAGASKDLPISGLKPAPGGENESGGDQPVTVESYPVEVEPDKPHRPREMPGEAQRIPGERSDVPSAQVGMVSVSVRRAGSPPEGEALETGANGDFQETDAGYLSQLTLRERDDSKRSTPAQASQTLPSIEEAVSEKVAKPQPVVRVTIGRIEVRAVRQPAPAPSPSPVRLTPSLTLDEYLKRRNGEHQ